MTEPSDVLRHSVTRDDHTDEAGRKGSVLNFMVMPTGDRAGGLPPQPPSYWSKSRDDILRSTLYYESGWAGAVYIGTTKMASLSWFMKGLGLKARRARELLMQADGGLGYIPFMSKHLRDFLTTDNGAFIEVVRATRSPGSRILGLFHLDSRRCMRTGDPDVPVIYRDRKDRLHELKAHQVLAIADMPDPGDTWFGVGYCAASRAYPAIYRQWALERYVTEKVTGRRATSLHFVNNINDLSIKNAITTAESDANSRGYVSYLGAIIIPNIDPTAPPGVATIDLVGLPEGFNADMERRNAFLLYANALGLDPQEIDPQLLASKALGTGAQARVIDDKASGKGLVAWRQAFTHMLNEYIVPDDVTFFFQERDYRDQIQAAELADMRTETQVKRINAGIISPQQALQLLVDVDDLPQDFIANDETPIEEVGDIDNPLPQSDVSGIRQEFDEFGQPEKSEEEKRVALGLDPKTGQTLEKKTLPQRPKGDNRSPKPRQKEYSDLSKAQDILKRLNGR